MKIYVNEYILVIFRIMWMMFFFLIGLFLRDDEIMIWVGYGYIRFVFSVMSYIRINFDIELKSIIDGELK